MRGFRASRAAQNFKSAHFGKQNQQNQVNSGHNGPNSPQQQEKRPLPDWLKIHETPPQAAATATTVTKPAKTTATKPNLRVVKASVREVSAKTSKTVKATGTAKTRTRVKTAVTGTKKRKAA
ncbi:MAG: hypothetical protein HY074_19730 [Deltaproteobacteria bacterium]|nr:hypothetical protein [Deltaproteobacteria bacterium]